MGSKKKAAACHLVTGTDVSQENKRVLAEVLGREPRENPSPDSPIPWEAVIERARRLSFGLHAHLVANWDEARRNPIGVAYGVCDAVVLHVEDLMVGATVSQWAAVVDEATCPAAVPNLFEPDVFDMVASLLTGLAVVFDGHPGVPSQVLRGMHTSGAIAMVTGAPQEAGRC